jgi:hypothetical protein
MTRRPRLLVDSMVSELLTESLEDYVGLWEIVHKVSKVQSDEVVIRAESLRVARILLEKGLIAGKLRRGGGFEPWPIQESDAVMRRIEMEWEKLGHLPGIDDICWFNRP